MKHLKSELKLESGEFNRLQASGRRLYRVPGAAPASQEFA
jgi:hypothetical protein